MRAKTILCPVDFSEATPFGLEPAMSLATELGAEVVLLHVSGLPGPEATGSIPYFDLETLLRDVRERANRRLEKLAAREARDGLSIRWVVKGGTTASEIVGAAVGESADLIVLPTHSRRGLERLILGSVAEKVVRLAPCPVLTIHPGGDEPAGFSPTKVIFATDFSDYSDAALPDALALAEQYGADLLMVHVATVFESDPANPEWAFPEIPREYAEAVTEMSGRELDLRSADARQRGIQVATRMLRGFDPAMKIDQLAEQEGVGLIVIATHGRTGLMHALIGSTAERVVRYAECPVLTVRPPKNAGEGSI